jgi:hypothetical protein
MSVVLCDRLTDMRAARRLTATKLYNPSPGVGGRGTYTRGQSVITPQIRVSTEGAALIVSEPRASNVSRRGTTSFLVSNSSATVKGTTRATLAARRLDNEFAKCKEGS